LVLRLTEPLRMDGSFALSRAPFIRARLPSPLSRATAIAPLADKAYIIARTGPAHAAHIF
jgi:hypothetical protein